MFIWHLKAFDKILREAFLNLITDFLEFLQTDRFVWAYNPWETRVSLAITFPNFLFVPFVDKGEEFQEENTKIVTFSRGATVNTRQNTLQNFCYRF